MRKKKGGGDSLTISASNTLPIPAITSNGIHLTPTRLDPIIAGIICVDDNDGGDKEECEGRGIHRQAY